MGSISRHSTIKNRKNFLPSLLITLFLWGAISGIIYFVEPEAFGAVPFFFTIIFLAILFTSSLVFGNKRRGLIVSVSLTLFILLRYFGIGNILNFLLLAGLAVSIELYLAKK